MVIADALDAGGESDVPGSLRLGEAGGMGGGGFGAPGGCQIRASVYRGTVEIGERRWDWAVERVPAASTGCARFSVDWTSRQACQ